MIRLLNCAAADLLAAEKGPAALVHADPPWSYSQGSGWQGCAQDQYSGLPMEAIARDLDAAWALAADNCYLMMWATFPLLAEWMAAAKAMRWEYLTGGCWGKTGGLGVGFHFRGDSELLLVYRKGNPRPAASAASNLWLAPRGTHSEKPQGALEVLIRMGTAQGDLVLDLYAGESASMARACRRLGRRYVGAEMDPVRHATAMGRLGQGELFSLAPRVALGAAP